MQEIKDTVADVTADITSRSLGDEEVKAKAENLSKSVVHEVLWKVNPLYRMAMLP